MALNWKLVNTMSPKHRAITDDFRFIRYQHGIIVILGLLTVLRADHTSCLIKGVAI
jgi:hypothetical protein